MRRDAIGQHLVGKSGIGLEARRQCASALQHALFEAHDQRRIRVLDDARELGQGEVRRDGIRDRTELPGRHASAAQLEAVGEAYRDEVSLSHPALRVGAGEPVRAPLELDPRERPVVTDKRQAIGLFLGEASEHPSE